MSNSDIYNYESAQKRNRMRRQKMLALKKKRKRQLLIKKCIVAGVAIVLIAGFLKWQVFSNTEKKSEITENQTIAVAVDKDSAINNQSQDSTPPVAYAQKSTNYKEVSDEDVLSPFIALVEVESGKIIAGREAQTQIYPASMTKVMTLLVVVENLKDFSMTYTFPADILNELYLDEATVAGFEVDETVSVDDLLYGLILPSGADSAIALATLTAGSEEAFVELMNNKAEQLGLKQTHFSNPTGLHSNDQYTTPVEMAMIMEAAMSNPLCVKYLSAYQHTTAATSQHPEGILLTSTMFSRMYGDEIEGVKITAGKTGYTNEALHCLVNYAEKNGKHYVAVEAGAQDKWYTIFDSFKLYKDYVD